jgi:peptidoglycan/LPS O-acetylase OafA/YrhL
MFEPLIAAIAFASIIAVLCRRTPEQNPRWLQTGPLAAASRYSYGMYTLHVVVIILLIGSGVPQIVPVLGYNLPYQLAFTALVVLACLVAGFLSWHLFESVFVKLAPSYGYSARHGKAAVQGTERVIDSAPMAVP